MSVDVVVTAPAKAPKRVDTTVTTEEARKVPGAMGDPLRAIHALPGVSRPPFGGGEIVSWGSAPEETRVYVDGVEIPALYHGSGLRSVLPADFVQSFGFLPGAFGAEYGRALGGVVRVTTAPVDSARTSLIAQGDLLDSGAVITTPLGERAAVRVAGRYGYAQSLVRRFAGDGFLDFYSVPRYHDAQAKLSIGLRANEELSVVALTSHDDARRTVPSSDPARRRSEARDLNFHRLYMRYTRGDDGGDRVWFTPFVGVDEFDTTGRFGALPLQLRERSIMYGARAAHRARVASWLTTDVGLDVLGTVSSIDREGTLTLPAREGDVSVFGRAPSSDFVRDAWTTHVLDIGAHGELQFERGPLQVVLGSRLDVYLLESSHVVPATSGAPPIGTSRAIASLQPRALVRFRATPALSWFVSAGRYSQPPSASTLGPITGNPSLGPSSATHVAVGEELAIDSATTTELTLFRKTYEHLVVRSPLATPDVASTLVQDGEGRSWGTQIMLRRKPRNGLSGWIAFTMSRSERGERLFDYDQPYVLSAVVSKALGAWSFGARFRYASGAPRTPVVSTIYDVQSDEQQPSFGRQNSIRLPSFHQVDVRVDRRFRLAGDRVVELYLDLQNTTFHSNAEELVYSADYRTRGYVFGMPTLAVIGARLEL